MSRSFGTGSPLWFFCSKCRSARARDVELTGNVRDRRSRRALGLRSSRTSREYRCRCGHVGWSNHKDLERRL